MLVIVLIVVFLAVAGMNWWVGTWNAMINLINFFIAALVASSFYENLAQWSESFDNSYRLLADFVAIWLLFAVTFGLLRMATDLLSKYQLKMNIWVDLTARSVLSLWLAAGFVCFTFFTLHLAPLPPDVYPVRQNEKLFGIGPDQMWMAFIQSRSRGALSQAKNGMFLPEYNLTDHPDDVDLDARVFDPWSTFAARNGVRRLSIAENGELRVAK